MATPHEHLHSSSFLFQAVELAREAFILIDKDGDGTLSRKEVLRAFRLNPMVREKIIPIIPMPSAAKNSLTGVDIQARRSPTAPIS